MASNRRRNPSKAALASLAAVLEMLESRQMLADTVGYNGGTYSQNFDGLIASGANQTPGNPFDLSGGTFSASGTMDGWAADVAPADVRGATSTAPRFRVDNGGGTTGSVYSYGTGTNTDRALGALASASNVSAVGVTLVNSTGSNITSFNVTFDGEMWHRGNQATPNKLLFGYNLGGSIGDADASFTPVPQLDYAATSTAAPNDQARDGNNASFRTAGITFTVAGITWTPDQHLVLRWADTNDTGNDDGIAIDDFKFTVPPPSPGKLSLSSATYSVNEDAGTATITVNRANGNSGPVDVSYAATPGTAADPSDFSAVSGTLHWNDLDLAPKSFNVPIADTPGAEPTETVNLALSNPTGGATLDAPNTAVLSIIDNDAAVPTGLLLNEVSANPAGNDNPYEYVELRGAPSQSLENVFFVSIEGDGGAAGLADRVVSLNGQSLGTNGLALLKSATGHASQDAATTIITNALFDNAGGGLENGANTFALIYSQTPIVQDSDLDPGNDGTLDLPGGAVLLDAVGWKDQGVGTAYNVELTQSSGTPDAATRFPGNTTSLSAGAWYNADLLDNPTDLLYETARASSNIPPGATLTPGAANYFNASTNGAIGFTTAGFSVNEAAGTVTVNVVRTAGSDGAVDVNFAAVPGTAGGLDFTPTNGTLHFDPGQTTNSFNVSITDDPTAEGAETISLTLGGPTGGAIVAPRGSSTLTIGPNDGGVVLNEVYVNIPSGAGADAPFEYVELRGVPNASLNGLFFVSIEGEIGGSTGVADIPVPLAGATLGSNGLLMIKSTTSGYTPQDANTHIVTTTALDTGGNNLENGSNSFALIYTPTAIAAGTDLDTGNDGGAFDNLPNGSETLDGIGWIDPSESSTGIVYGVALTQSSGTPDAATRFPTDLTPNSFNAWYDGDIAAASSYATAITYDGLKASANLPSGAVITPGGANFPITGDATPPAIENPATFDFNAARQSITLDFTEPVTFTTADFVLTQLPATTIPSANIIIEPGAGDTFKLKFQNYPANALPDGRYSLHVIKDNVKDAAGNAMTANYDFSFFVFDGDANRDEKVNALDFNAISSHYGQSTTFVNGDFNYDGTVNTLDFNQLAARFGQTLPFLPAPPPLVSLFSSQPIDGGDSDLAELLAIA